MKKLMITLAAVAIGVAAQASNINWAVNVVDDATVTALDYEGYTVYIVGADCTSFKNLAAVQAAVLGATGASGELADSGFGDEVATFGTVEGTWTEGTTVNFKTVIVDDDKTGYWITSGSAEAYDTKGEHTDYNLDAGALLQTSITEWEAVPEPFSGTLALLGMGAIALRRKMKKAKKA